MPTDYASVFSAVAAGFSALTAALVYRREWGLRRPNCLPPRCYWVGYMDDEKNEPRMCIALPVHAVSLGGLSGVIEDIMLEVETQEWGKSLWFQPEFQTDIEKATGALWREMNVFVPLAVKGKNVSTTVVVFGRRSFKGDPKAYWCAGEYHVVAEETATHRDLFSVDFKLDADFPYGDTKLLTVRANFGIVLSPRRWTRQLLDKRDNCGQSHEREIMTPR